MTRRAAAFLLALTGAVPVCGQTDDAAGDDLAHGRIRQAEPGVVLQRADDAAAEDAAANTPFMPGDRVWSDAAGRAELQFPDGSALRLDRRTRLDYVEHEADRGDELIVLSVAAGSVSLRVRDDRRRADFLIETPDARVEVRAPGSYRLDVEPEETRLRVYAGAARLESARRSVQLASGETSFARRGEAPTHAADFDGEDEDDFARWDEEQGDVAWQADSLRYLPEEVQPYAADFDTYGQWHYEAEAGYVWRPRVYAGWRPYSDGRWTWTRYGWTWVPFESWGWAPSHYGRWGRSASLGWYWIPGRRFGPAWVSWRTGGDYVGWCPLGRGNRPVGEPVHRGYATPRAAGAPVAGGAHWTYARRADMGTRAGARRRVALDPLTASQTAPVDARLQLNRELRPVEREHAVPRAAARTRPTAGDYVPELRYDPRRTIPPPMARRRPPADDRRSAPPAAESDGAPRATQGSEAERRQPGRRDVWDPARARTPGVSSSERATGSSSSAGRTTSGARETEPDTAAERKRRTPSEDAEVLRHFFTPLVEPRGETARAPSEQGTRDDSRSGSPRAGAAPEAERRAPRHAAPRHAAPRREAEPRPQPSPPPSSSSSGEGGAKERQPSRSRDRHR